MAFTLKDFQHHEWLSKTNFSFLTGASHPHQMVQSAAALGYSSLSVNDFDGVYGIARAHNDLKHYKKENSTSFQLNYGCEIHLQEDHDHPVLQQKTLALIAKNSKGYQQMNELITKGHQRGKNNSYVTPPEILKHNLSDVFTIVPMRLYPWEENDIPFLKNLKAHLKGSLNFALTRTLNRWSDHRIQKVHSLTQDLEAHSLICQDAFFHHRDQKSFHDILVSLKKNQTLTESLTEVFPNGERSFHSLQFLWQTYSSFPNFQKIAEHSQAMAAECHFCLSELTYHYPREMIPNSHTPQSFLEKITWEGARKHFGAQLPESIVRLISKELDLIEDLKFADYFLTVWDIVRWAREQNILCQGRGSAANSAVCFVLGITSCDPSHFDLLFERFISKERGDPPDIDVDFEHERREEVLQYIYERYGRKKAAMVANVITFRKKAALRAVGKTLGVPETLLTQASKKVSQVSARGQGFHAVLKQIQNTSTKKILSDFQWRLWGDMAEQLHGFPHHMGVHSGGFIISQHPMTQLVPVEPATMEGRTVIQWCKDDIEELGFFKIDCLSLGMLTALRKCFTLVKDKYGPDFNLKNIPQEDPATYSMIQRADTVGVFQIESRAQMSMLPRLKPRCFYDLVIEIAIIRPGPIQGQVIHPYLRRRDGVEPVTYPDPRVKETLAKTLGVVIFQEQAMRLAMALGDFTPGEANELRKNIGSWNSKTFDRNLNPYLKKLLRGLKRNKINKKFAEQLMEQMKGFSHYGFPESHAISFAFIAYASCYLKCHYPAAFCVSVLNSQPMGFYSPHALLSNAKRQGIPILPLSVNSSTWDHQLELLPKKEGRPSLYAIRLGFRIVKGLSQKAVKQVSQYRKTHGPWTSLEQFTKTLPLYRDDFAALAATNAFAELGTSRFEALWGAHAYPFRPLIDMEEKAFPKLERSVFQKIQMDFSSFGTSLHKHPTEILRTQHWPYELPVESLSLAKSLETARPQKQIFIFGMLLAKQAPPSAKGMVFFTLEDETGFINLAFTPQVYKKYQDIAESFGFLCIQGQLQKVKNYHSILVTKVLRPAKTKVTPIHSDNVTSDRDHQLSLKPRSYY